MLCLKKEGIWDAFDVLCNLSATLSHIQISLQITFYCIFQYISLYVHLLIKGIILKLYNQPSDVILEQKCTIPHEAQI